MTTISFSCAVDALLNKYPNAPNSKLAALAFTEMTDLDPVLLKYLRDHRIGIGLALNLAGPIGLHQCALGARVFDFSFEGEQAVVAIVHDPVDCETEIDLVAWCAADPRRFATLLGEAAILGTLGGFAGHPVPVHRTPLGWLQSGCTGAVILSARRARPLVAQMTGPIIAENQYHGRALVKALAPALAESDVLVPRPDTRAA